MKINMEHIFYPLQYFVEQHIRTSWIVFMICSVVSA
jgi:hypothetical protein